MSAICWLPPGSKPVFPPVAHAMAEPNGLLAAGGDLSTDRLLAAYREGIFPWYSDGQPILWWSPNPRAVLFPERVRIPRSLHRVLRSGQFRVSMDTAFERVIRACAAPRKDDEGTWITSEMLHAYERLHRLGLAHSVEVWRAENLVGGLYGVAFGRLFFGESMFSRTNDASKVALVHLCGQLLEWGFPLIDCQQTSAHLQRMGAEDIPRSDFVRLLRQWRDAAAQPSPWRLGWTYTEDFRRVETRRAEHHTAICGHQP